METSNNKQEKSFQGLTRSLALLPILSILSIVIIVCSKLVDGFNEDINPVICWLYFSVVVIYIGISIVDNILNNKENKKKFIAIFILSFITLVVDILFIIFVR